MGLDALKAASDTLIISDGREVGHVEGALHGARPRHNRSPASGREKRRMVRQDGQTTVETSGQPLSLTVVAVGVSSVSGDKDMIAVVVTEEVGWPRELSVKVCRLLL